MTKCSPKKRVEKLDTPHFKSVFSILAKIGRLRISSFPPEKNKRILQILWKGVKNFSDLWKNPDSDGNSVRISKWSCVAYICNHFQIIFYLSLPKSYRQLSNMILHCFSSIDSLPEILKNRQSYFTIKDWFNIWGCGLFW